jgi:hypothetical protein
MRGPSWLGEAVCTAPAMVLFCTFMCCGMLLLTGLVWLLAALNAQALILPVFGVGMLANLPLSFVLGGRFARWLFPLDEA